MKIFNSILLAGWLSLSLFSCTKEEPIPDPEPATADTNFVGNYRINKVKMAYQGWPTGYDQYVFIGGTGNIEILTKDSSNFYFGEKLALTGNTFVDSYGDKSTLTKNGTELKVQDEESELPIYYLSDPSLPERSTLLTFVNTTTSLDAPGTQVTNYGTGLIANGQNMEIIMDNFDYQHTIYSIDRVSKLITDSLPFYFLSSSDDNMTGALCFVNGYYWVGNGNTIEKIDPTTGESIFQSIAVGDLPVEAMAFDGTDLILAESNFNANTSELYRYNIAANTVEKITNVTSRIEGITFVNGKLYLTRNNNVYRCTLSPFKVEKSYQIAEDLHASGIANFGNEFWISTIRQTGVYSRIEQITVD